MWQTRHGLHAVEIHTLAFGFFPAKARPIEGKVLLPTP